MCGITALAGPDWQRGQLQRMTRRLAHRGPDAEGIWVAPGGTIGLGHRRLQIIDLSTAGNQPMASADGALQLSFNGEIYNYLELRTALSDYPFRSRSDTEVVLAAYARWGTACLDRLLGMFAFVLWDGRRQELLAARDRFGVKPLYYAPAGDGGIALASEIKALWEAVPAIPDAETWAAYLRDGLYEHSPRTFWRGVWSLPPGHLLRWSPDTLRVQRWYDVADATGGELDERPDEVVAAEYADLLEQSVRLRFRADVPVGVSVSGGLDSSTLLGAVRAVQPPESRVNAFTFVTGDPAYDELPWVRQALRRTAHPLTICRLTAEQVPALAEAVQRYEDEPFGGVPTLAYARVFEHARAAGVTVLLDGQGMDEQWAGYDYYAHALSGRRAGVVQGTQERPTRADCLVPEFSALAAELAPAEPFGDPLRNTQYRDLRYTKLPRALRFNDRVSMRSSIELREPFLDHRLVELALRQPAGRKVRAGVHKWLLRRVARSLVPEGITEAPKRPLQTPQREWLRGPLRRWANEQIEAALDAVGGTWIEPARVRQAWATFADGAGDQSFFVWQWITLGLMLASDAGPRFGSGPVVAESAHA